MKHLLLSTVLVLLTLASPLSRADFELDYPAGERAFALELSNGIAFVHWDVHGTGDLFTLHSTPIADPLVAALDSAEPGLGYWLQFAGTTSDGHLLFHVQVNINGSWFPIEDFVL